jgi:BirA family biotin operon repressor/biotin-[acetyl-CoA-carboxylase] ligase
VKLVVADPPAQTLSLAAGLALIEALGVVAPEAPFLLKWPNDLMLADRKLAGILLERNGDRVAVGFGVNLAVAPELAERQAAALPANVSPQAFTPLLAASFARLLELWRSTDAASFARAWQERAHPLGTQLTVHSSADEVLSGRFDGLEPDGALRLRREDGALELVRAGDVDLG